ncbi:hypothetical protein CTI14_17545 [Methylobacterium radiotolerans]|nr:hypothetical protein CTI14_17545 [Methylobacterium radiotolerans]
MFRLGPRSNPNAVPGDTDGRPSPVAEPPRPSAEPDLTPMLDIVFLAGGLAFFVAAAGYAAACDRL